MFLEAISTLLFLFGRQEALLGEGSSSMLASSLNNDDGRFYYCSGVCV